MLHTCVGVMAHEHSPQSPFCYAQTNTHREQTRDVLKPFIEWPTVIIQKSPANKTPLEQGAMCVK